jgi:Tfp pilus assembly protein PilF
LIYKAIALNQEFPGFYSTLAFIEIKEKNYEIAASYLLKALRYLPFENHDLSNALVKIYLFFLATKDYQAARKICGMAQFEQLPEIAFYLIDRLLKEEPTNSENYVLRAEIYLMLNKHNAAKLDYEAALKLNPYAVSARWGLLKLQTLQR